MQVDPSAEAEPEPERVHLHMPIDVRSTSLAIMALLASVYELRRALRRRRPPPRA